MEKLWLIIKREYITRVKRRSFILATLLTPLALALFFVVIHFIFDYESDDSKRIAIIDEAEIIEGGIKDEKNLFFKVVDTKLEDLRMNFEDSGFDGILYLPALRDVYAKAYDIQYYSDDKLTLDVEPFIRQKVGKIIRSYKIKTLNIDIKELEALDTKISIQPRSISSNDEEQSKLSGSIAAVIGMLMGIIMYMTVFIYGMMVMRSVMEEKTNRIVEVMISSVKPFQLMMGKIIGVGAVGLTQVAIWAILIPAILFIVNIFWGVDTSQINAAPQMDQEETMAIVEQAMIEFNNQNWALIFPLFVLYFLGGYITYSSLFAAVGSAMGDDLGEGQSLTIPITIPVLLAFYIMMVAIQAPHSSLAQWSSMFPLFSPIVMPARLAFHPPLWEIAVSLILLFGTAIFFTWLSGRIYRTAILMYGKKTSLKNMVKWMFSKQ